MGDARYLNIRMLSILKFWPFVEAAIQSPWSNVRSICYGLVCSMLKVDLHDYRSSYQQRIRNLYQPLLLALLSGKESESEAGGLNILGSICGLSHDFSSQESLGAMLGVFRRNSEFISMPLWQQVPNQNRATGVHYWICTMSKLHYYHYPCHNHAIVQDI